MTEREQKIWEFYIEVLRELDIEDKIYMSGDQENIFAYAYKKTFGYFPEGF